MTNFESKNNIGKYGEGVVMDFLNKRDTVINVKDVSDVKRYQETDIDFLLETVYPDIVKVEVKTTQVKHRNLFVELVSNASKGEDGYGWFYKSKADWIFHYFTELDLIVAYDFEEFKVWFNSYQDTFKDFNNSTSYGRGSYDSYCKIVPFDLLAESNVTHRIYKGVK